MPAKLTLEAKMNRWWMNNSVPVIQHRILQILGAADGQRLKRSQLTQKLSNLRCIRNESRIEALRQLEAAGKIRRETYQVHEGSVQRGEIWELVGADLINIRRMTVRGGSKTIAKKSTRLNCSIYYFSAGRFSVFGDYNYNYYT